MMLGRAMIRRKSDGLEVIYESILSQSLSVVAAHSAVFFARVVAQLHPRPIGTNSIFRYNTWALKLCVRYRFYLDITQASSSFVLLIGEERALGKSEV